MFSSYIFYFFCSGNTFSALLEIDQTIKKTFLKKNGVSPKLLSSKGTFMKGANDPSLLVGSEKVHRFLSCCYLLGHFFGNGKYLPDRRHMAFFKRGGGDSSVPSVGHICWIRGTFAERSLQTTCISIISNGRRWPPSSGSVVGQCAADPYEY